MFDVGKVCPKCNSTHLGEGVLNGYAAMMPKGKMFTMGSPITATVCTKCGHIIEMRVKDPEKFVDNKKNRL